MLVIASNMAGVEFVQKANQQINKICSVILQMEEFISYKSGNSLQDISNLTKKTEFRLRHD